MEEAERTQRRDQAGRLSRQMASHGPSILCCRFPAAEKEEVFRVQQTMVQAWNIVSQVRAEGRRQ